MGSDHRGSRHPRRRHLPAAALLGDRRLRRGAQAGSQRCQPLRDLHVGDMLDHGAGVALPHLEARAKRRGYRRRRRVHVHPPDALGHCVLRAHNREHRGLQPLAHSRRGARGGRYARTPCLLVHHPRVARQCAHFDRVGRRERPRAAAPRGGPAASGHKLVHHPVVVRIFYWRREDALARHRRLLWHVLVGVGGHGPLGVQVPEGHHARPARAEPPLRFERRLDPRLLRLRLGLPCGDGRITFKRG
mmetsp:Transcript_47402/g.138232  ORF Transcript_47402/g.138232 Transcript_47402/m.138232 type:complete len:246 (-) Transcript_47402:272-1009(-)